MYPMKVFAAGLLVVSATTSAFQNGPAHRRSIVTRLQFERNPDVSSNAEQQRPTALSSSPGGDAPSGGLSRDQFFQISAWASLAAGVSALSSNALTKDTLNKPASFIEETGTVPGLTDPKLNTLTAKEVAGLFGQWNNALLTGDPDTVAKRYAKGAVLLPTKSNVPRTDYDGIRDYFVGFLAKKPKGTIIESYVQTQPNYAVDVGIYEFKFEDGQRIRARYSFLYTKEDGCWKIKHHHSSAMPETKAADIKQDI